MSQRDGTTRLSPFYDAAYLMWSSIWAPELRKVCGIERLHSDGFTRQHEILTLFHGNDVAALSLLTRANLSARHWRDDSYFQHWPEIAIQKLICDGTNVLVSSYFTVDPKYRKNTTLPVKEILVGLNIRRMKELGCSAMTGNMRNTKGMNLLCYEWGATPILKNVSVHGEPSDLIGFYRKTAKAASRSELLEQLDELWSRREISDELQLDQVAA